MEAPGNGLLTGVICKEVNQFCREQIVLSSPNDHSTDFQEMRQFMNSSSVIKGNCALYIHSGASAREARQPSTMGKKTW